MPAYSISHIKYHSPTSGRAYFLDANVWIYRLSTIITPKPHEEIYIKFFDSIIENGARIVVCPILVSEILNTYLRIGYENYKKKPGCSSAKYKDDFRPTVDYKNYLQNFQSELVGYEPYLLHIEDNYDSLLNIQQLQVDEDFNDLYYSNLCGSLRYTVVTHDKDFYYPGVDVLTANGNLIARR